MTYTQEKQKIKMAEIYEHAMSEALKLAEKGRYTNAPNPCVGAVLLKDNTIIASGFHAIYGQDHAEVACIKNAKKQGIDTRGTSLVVTLEPCNHTGKTPPCTRAIIEAGISKVVIGMLDPHEISGDGIQFLKDNNVEVISGILEEECKNLLTDYLIWIKEKRPYVILKMATSLDAKISAEKNKQSAITGEQSRKALAELRASVGTADGLILIGNNTFLVDNPQLTARNVECTKQARVGIITSSLPEVKNSSYIIQNRIEESLFCTNISEANSQKAEDLRSKGAKVYALNYLNNSKELDIKNFLKTLFEKEKIYYILCEGGAGLATSLFKQECVDSYRQFIAPKLFNSENSQSLLNPFPNSSPINLQLEKTLIHGQDIELIYKISKQ